MRVGGRAEWLLEPARPEELVEAYRETLERGLRPRFLGGGANLIVADGELPGVVITTARMGRVFRLPGPDNRGGENGADGLELPRTDHFDGDEPVLAAWAGAPMPGLVRTARDLGWSGLEGLVGVPGHLGGGVAMNAGGRWGTMWDVVERVRLLTPEGDVVERERDACAPRYRDGNLGGAFVLGAVLRLEVADAAEVRERTQEYLRTKSAVQPVTERSSGCIFRNPDPELADGRSAGELVEACGGKGLARGDAIVSPKHANFIVNRGRASAADVLGLIDDLRRLVLERTGIELAREVVVWSAERGTQAR